MRRKLHREIDSLPLFLPSFLRDSRRLSSAPLSPFPSSQSPHKTSFLTLTESILAPLFPSAAGRPKGQRRNIHSAHKIKGSLPLLFSSPFPRFPHPLTTLLGRERQTADITVKSTLAASFLGSGRMREELAEESRAEESGGEVISVKSYRARERRNTDVAQREGRMTFLTVGQARQEQAGEGA